MHPILAVPFLAACLALAGCGATGSSSEPRPPAKTNPQSVKVNMDEIFPPGRGRDLVLNNCTTCHTFVPIVVLRMTKEAWERNSRDHRERVTALSDADFKTLYEYLAANFNPDRSVPKLPQELLDTWTAN
jgi:mono/diheme cytochrome c family protein